MNRYFPQKGFYITGLLFITAILLFSGCTKKDTITFSAEIKSVSDNSILVKTIDYPDFAQARVDLQSAEYDFELSDGQIVEVTILPEIKESDPVQVTGVKLELKKETVRKISEFFPFRENERYAYEGNGNEFASYVVYNDYVSDDKIQQMVSNGGTQTVRVLELRGGKLINVFSESEVYYRENMLDQKSDSEEILLMEPLKKGTSWTLEDGRQRTITDASSEIKTATGTYTAIEVTTEGEDGLNVDYYAKDVGLIKTIFRSSGMEVSSTLKNIEKNAFRVQAVRFYYPDEDEEVLNSISKEVSFRTNESTSQVLEDAYKETVNSSYGIVLSTDAAIKSLTMDKDKVVHIDFNASLLSEMNAGAGYESIILQCIANTFGHYYDTEEVIITVEGKPYESGHIKMEEGQVIQVKDDGTVEKE